MHCLRGLLTQHAGGAGPHAPAARGHGVREVERRAVLRGDRGGEPALRPVARGAGERSRRDERHGGARPGRAQRGVEPGGTGSDDDQLRVTGPRQGRYGTGDGRRASAAHPPELARSRPRAPPRAGGAGSSPSSGSSRPASGSAGGAASPSRWRARCWRPCTQPAHIDALRALSDARGRPDRSRHRDERGLVPRGATRRGRSRRARRAAGLTARRRTGFSVHRPPGHHAGREQAMGFCLFNNVAVAARHAVDALGVERVLVFDWDVHHGNGTNDIFHASTRGAVRLDPSVAAVSRHRPGGRRRRRRRERDSPSICRCRPGSGDAEFVGADRGRGRAAAAGVRARAWC